MCCSLVLCSELVANSGHSIMDPSTLVHVINPLETATNKPSMAFDGMHLERHTASAATKSLQPCMLKKLRSHLLKIKV